MATYSFTIKKGKYQLELITTDKELLTGQFEHWIREAGEYAKQKKTKEHKDAINSQIEAEEEITRKNIEKQIKSDRTIEQKEESANINIKSGQNVSSTSNDLDIFYTPINNEQQQEQKEEQKEEQNESSDSTGVFDNILENSIKNPQTELSFRPSPSIKKDYAYINFMGGQKIEKKIDYLLYTAYYYSQYEQKPRFTLKQLNSKLMQNLAVIIDHSILQEAINRDYIECLPDLTGLIGASEYRLTAYGEKTILDA